MTERSVAPEHDAAFAGEAGVAPRFGGSRTYLIAVPRLTVAASRPWLAARPFTTRREAAAAAAPGS